MGMKEMGRLALRVEGDLWCAYYALPDTMDGAVFLGSIQMAFVQDEDRKTVFMMLMEAAVGDLIEESTGTRPVWKNLRRAPEHERSGSA
jgi:hypothetical protein